VKMTGLTHSGLHQSTRVNRLWIKFLWWYELKDDDFGWRLFLSIFMRKVDLNQFFLSRRRLW
jgi:hypothetical protein